MCAAACWQPAALTADTENTVLARGGTASRTMGTSRLPCFPRAFPRRTDRWEGFHLKNGIQLINCVPQGSSFGELNSSTVRGLNGGPDSDPTWYYRGALGDSFYETNDGQHTLISRSREASHD